MVLIIDEVTMQDVRDAKPEKIYYGANTPWWTHDPEHLCEHPNAGLPCDPRGGMLMETDKVDSFLSEAEGNAENGQYGKHGLRAFMAAHNSNCIMSNIDRKSTCLDGWPDYNEAIDAVQTDEEAEACIDIVFDGPAGAVSGRFVETENERGEGISVGEWVERPDGYHALRIKDRYAEGLKVGLEKAAKYCKERAQGCWDQAKTEDVPLEAEIYKSSARAYSAAAVNLRMMANNPEGSTDGKG